MKNKILITFLAILGLFIINIFSINGFYNNYEGKKLYGNKDFSGSLNYFTKNKDYIGLYNIGNIYYKLGEKSLSLQGGDLERVIKLWKKSLEYYKNSMQINYTKNAEENYNFVSKKLDELLKKQKEKGEDTKVPVPKDKKGNSGTGTQENKNNKGNKAQNQEKGKEKEVPVPKDKKGNSGTGTQESTQQLSPQVKQQIKAYEEKLKQEQKKNAKNFGKVYKENNRKDIFDNFNDFFEDDPFFNNSLLNNKDEKKDW